MRAMLTTQLGDKRGEKDFDVDLGADAMKSVVANVADTIKGTVQEPGLDGEPAENYLLITVLDGTKTSRRVQLAPNQQITTGKDITLHISPI